MLNFSICEKGKTQSSVAKTYLIIFDTFKNLSVWTALSCIVGDGDCSLDGSDDDWDDLWEDEWYSTCEDWSLCFSRLIISHLFLNSFVF